MRALIDAAINIQRDANKLLGPAEEGAPARSQLVIPASVVRRTRGYIEKVVNQVNGTYEHGWYDACAVMIRRLVETLIIEACEHRNQSDLIQGSDGNYFMLKDLIAVVESRTEWGLGRESKKALSKLKTIGDLSAHSRRHNTHRGDIESVMTGIRTLVQELVYLAGLK